MEVNEENQCTICDDELTDPRIYPCWHVACFTCILETTLSDVQGRALCCRRCRATLLFDNIRSLPKPIPCVVCGSRANDPVTFPCCNRVTCLQCVFRSQRVEDGLVCANRCVPAARYAIRDISQARICPVCFALHKNPAKGCGEHFICIRCDQSTLGDSSQCILCQAVACPAPVQVNPMMESSDNVVSKRQTFQQQANNQANQNDLVPAQPIRQPQQQAALGRLECDAIKAVIALIVFGLTVFVYGFCFLTWAAVAVTMLVLRFNLALSLGVMKVILNIIFILSFYHFYHAVIYWVLGIFIEFAIVPIYPVASGLVLLHLCSFYYIPYDESIFLHKLMLEFVIGLLVGVVETLQRRVAP